MKQEREQKAKTARMEKSSNKAASAKSAKSQPGPVPGIEDEDLKSKTTKQVSYLYRFIFLNILSKTSFYLRKKIIQMMMMMQTSRPKLVITL